MTNSTFAALAFASLVACSGDEIKTGVFVDSPVQGLRYTTKTRSGLTSATGELQYVAGETVTFSIGGVELGSARGADRITPFDLFQIPVPSTEADVVEVMSASTRVDAFDRAANVIYFLVALDRDGYPENGIDLSGWDEALADETLSFDVDASDFPYEAYRRMSLRHDGMATSLALEKPLAHFYRSMGIVVSAHLVTASSVDEGDDGVLEEVRHYEYDSKGWQTSMRLDNGADGTIEQHYATTYDTAGNGIMFRYMNDNDHNGSFEDRNEYTYAHDAAGRVVTEYFQLVANDLVTSRQTRTYTYDGRGQVLTVDTESDTNADAITDTRSHETSTYDEHGYRATLRLETDQYADGSVNSVTHRTFAYDAAGFEVDSTYETDPENDGVVNTRTVSTYVRDQAGRELTYTQDYFNGTGLLTRRDVRTNAYDERGEVQLYRSESDSDADGVINSFSEYVYTYGDDGYLTLMQSTYEPNTAVAGFQLAIDTYERAPNGKTLRFAMDQDTDGDGVVDEREQTTYTYDELGYFSEALTEFDNTADGVFESRTRNRNTTSELTDGIAYLVYYFIAD